MLNQSESPFALLSNRGEFHQIRDGQQVTLFALAPSVKDAVCSIIFKFCYSPKLAFGDWSDNVPALLAATQI